MESRSSETMRSAASIPEATWPNAVYLPSRNGLSATTMKNWEPALSGSAERAMDTAPRLCGTELNSAFTE